MMLFQAYLIRQSDARVLATAWVIHSDAQGAVRQAMAEWAESGLAPKNEAEAKEVMVHLQPISPIVLPNRPESRLVRPGVDAMKNLGVPHAGA